MIMMMMMMMMMMAQLFRAALLLFAGLLVVATCQLERWVGGTSGGERGGAHTFHLQ